MTQTLREGFVWTTSHSKVVLSAILVFVVFGAGASIYSYFNTKKETSLQEKYYLIEKEYTEKKRGFEEVTRAETMAAQSKDKKNLPAIDLSKKASGDLQKDLGGVVTGFKALVSEAPKTVAAQMAALNLAEIFSNYKLSEDAIASLTQVEKSLSGKDAMSALILQKLGNLYADKGDCKTALEKWESIVSHKALTFAHDEAKLGMGLCYESLNDLAKAEQMYGEVSAKKDAETSNFAAAKDAERYLRILKAKKNLSSSGT